MLSRFYINYFLMTFYIMDLFLITLFFYVAAFIEGVNLKLQTLVNNKDFAKMSEQSEIKMINEIIEDHIIALDLVKSLEQVVSSIMLSQFVLFSYSFCFVMFNFTLVNIWFLVEMLLLKCKILYSRLLINISYSQFCYVLWL